MNLYRSLLWWLALAVLGALGWHWFSQDLGDVVIRFRGLTYTTTLAFLVVAWALLWFGLWTLGWLLGLPLRAWRRHARTQARNRLVSGLEALHQGRWARAADLLGMDRRQAEMFRDLQRGNFVALGPAMSRRPLPIVIGAVETSARSSSPSAASASPICSSASASGPPPCSPTRTNSPAASASAWPLRAPWWWSPSC